MTKHPPPSQFMIKPLRTLTKEERTARDAHMADADRDWEGDICDLAILADLTATLAGDNLSSSKPFVTIDDQTATHILFCIYDLRVRTAGLKTDYYEAWKVPAVPEPAADPLLLLGAEFEAAWRDQVAIFARLLDDTSDAAGDACDAAYKRTMSIADKIEAMRAASLEGLIVKARAASWCYQGNPFDVGTLDGGETQDKRLAGTIIRDLISLSGAPLPEIPETEEQAAIVARAPASRPDERLETLGLELDEVHAAKWEFDERHPYEENPHYDRHWALRSEINSLDAKTIAGLQVKARATAHALRFDETAACHVAGSFRYLARSLAADVLRLGDGDAQLAADAIAFLAEAPRETETLSC